MFVAFIVIVLIIFWFAVLGVTIGTIKAMVYAGFGIVLVWCVWYLFHDKLRKEKAEGALWAELIGEEPIYKEKIENTGFSLGYSWRSTRSYYRYKKVLSHYCFTFRVALRDGKTEIMRCIKDDEIYNILISKVKK